jgi:hypothetical protein
MKSISQYVEIFLAVVILWGPLLEKLAISQFKIVTRLFKVLVG